MKKAKHSTRKPVRQPEMEFAGTDYEFALSNLADVEAMNLHEVDHHEAGMREGPASRAFIHQAAERLKQSSSVEELERKLYRFAAKCIAIGRLLEVEPSAAEKLVQKDTAGDFIRGSNLPQLLRRA